MPARTQIVPLKRVSAGPTEESNWTLLSGRRLVDFVIAGGLAAPVLALALKHVMNAERRRKRARAR